MKFVFEIFEFCYLIFLDDLKRQLNGSNEKNVSSREMYLALQTRTTELSERLHNLTQEKNQLVSELLQERKLKENREEVKAK